MEKKKDAINISDLIERKKNLQQLITKKKEKLNYYKKVMDKIPVAFFISCTQTKTIKWLNNGIAKYLDNEVNTKVVANEYFNTKIPSEQLKDSLSEFSKPFQKNETTRDTVFDITQTDGKFVKYLAVTIPFGERENLSIAFEVNGVLTRNQQLEQLIRDLLKEKSNFQFSKLSKMELKVASLIGEGKTINQIANETYRSYHTIEFHKRNIQKKMNFSRIMEIVQFAKENGLSNNI